MFESTEGLSEYQIQRLEQTKELVKQLSSFVNTTSLDPKAFLELMSREHRTLQQSFTRLCLNWLEHCSKDEYRTDPRNEGSKEIAKIIMAAVEEKTGYKPAAYCGHV